MLRRISPAFLAVAAAFLVGCEDTSGNGGSYSGPPRYKEVNGQAEFDELVLKSDKPVLVDFWATWCGPCVEMAPIIGDLAADYNGKAIVVKIDIDENRELAANYGISSIPAFYVFHNGEVVDRVIGRTTKSNLASRLDKYLGSNAP